MTEASGLIGAAAEYSDTSVELAELDKLLKEYLNDLEHAKRQVTNIEIAIDRICRQKTRLGEEA